MSARRYAPECRQLTDEEEQKQHALYMKFMDVSATGTEAVGDLWYCRSHRCPVIECSDARKYK